VVTKKILPSMRSLLAWKLIHVYKLNQLDVAERLGVSQPAVSQYLKGIRGRNVKMIEKSDVIVRMIDELAHELAIRKIDEYEFQRKVCEICRNVRKTILKESF